MEDPNLAYLQSKSDNKPPSGSSSDLFQKAMELANQKRFEEAIAMYKEYLKSNPSSSAAYLNIALAYSNIKNSSEAQKNAEKSLELNPNQTKCFYILAAVKADQGDIDSARSILNDILKKDPNDQFAKNELQTIIGLSSVIKERNEVLETRKELMKSVKGAEYVRISQKMLLLFKELKSNQDYNVYVHAITDAFQKYYILIASQSFKSLAEATSKFNNIPDGRLFNEAKIRMMTTDAGRKFSLNVSELISMPADYILQRAQTQKNMQTPEWLAVREAYDKLLHTPEGMQYYNAMIKMQNTDIWRDYIQKYEMVEESKEFQDYLNSMLNIKQLFNSTASPKIAKDYLALFVESQMLRSVILTESSALANYEKADARFMAAVRSNPKLKEKVELQFGDIL